LQTPPQSAESLPVSVVLPWLRSSDDPYPHFTTGSAA
jgi:hypothetical protein